MAKDRNSSLLLHEYRAQASAIENKAREQIEGLEKGSVRAVKSLADTLHDEKIITQLMAIDIDHWQKQEGSYYLHGCNPLMVSLWPGKWCQIDWRGLGILNSEQIKSIGAPESERLYESLESRFRSRYGHQNHVEAKNKEPLFS